MKMHRPGHARPQRIGSLLIFVWAVGCLSIPKLLCAAQPRDANPSEELTIDKYLAELDRCAGAIQRPSEIPQLQTSLPPVWTVRSGDKRVEVSTAPIQSQLKQLQLHAGNSGKAARDLRQLLNAMKQEAESMAASPRNTPAAKAEPLLENIVHRKEFRDALGPSTEELLRAKINRWLFDMFVRLLNKLHLGKKTGNILAWSVIGLAFLLLCTIVWRWLARGAQPGPALPAISVGPSDARQWVQEALAAAERGDYRSALHCAYWAAIARLEDLGRLNRDRARTPRESLRLLEDRPTEHRLLQGITGIFERVWYGYRVPSTADWTGARELLEKIGCLSASTAPTANS
jgi:hypothetical protein